MLSRVKDTLLLVGDMKSARADLREIFRESFNLLEAESVSQALLLLRQNGGCVALVLVDIPGLTTEELRALMSTRANETDTEIPVVTMVLADGGSEQEERDFLLGAADVIRKPYTPLAVQRRVEVMVELFLHKWNLEKMVEEQSETIRNANQVMLDALSAIIEHRSTESGNHVLRIRRFTRILLEEVAECCPEYELTETMINSIAGASALHDIGKISVPDAILNKPGPLTDEEFEVMKTHTTVGGRLVEQLEGMSEVTFLRYAYNISLYHHERWDGKGYPCGLVGDQIPICAQVVGLTDAFDALTTQRVYKPAYPYQRAINMILNGECGIFSPKLLECFKHVRAKMVDLARQYADGYSPKSDDISATLPGPVWKRGTLDTLQLAQAKYQALLHYIDGTVLELDLDNDLYHVVYNSNPEFDAIVPNSSFHSIVEHLRQSDIHPEDMAVLDEMHNFIHTELFHQHLRRKTFSFRIFSQIAGGYLHHELVLMRVNTGNSDQHIVTAIWHRKERNETPRSADRDILYTAPALRGLVSSALRCRSDARLTIDLGLQDLYSLIGYTADEVEQQFGRSLTELIIPEDRPQFAAAVQEGLKAGGKIQTEFRMFRKNGEPFWALAKSRLSVEDGQEYVYFAIRDNSQSKAVQQQLQADIQRNQILIDQSGSIVFDWDLRDDTMYCSPKWKEHFGYEPVSLDYSAQLGIATHFHPDDLAEIRRMLQKLHNGTPTVFTEVRLADATGKYLWTKITATILKDKEGNVARIIGILQDIDELKRAALAMKEQAERDSLTKLLNKASTQTLITNYLAERREGALAGMLLLDLDNFKVVNDSYGHLYGDVVLTRVSAALRKLFRAQDIIGRIGGDEFMVLLKDIPSKELLHERCALLRETLWSMLEELMPEQNVSCSIGAALAPNHGMTYNELFKHADEALYKAKSLGKNQYRVYSTKDRYPAVRDAAASTTRIDSDDPNAVTNNSFERFVFHCMYESKDLDATVNELLAFLGNSFRVSRTYIFLNNEDNTLCSNTHEWCNAGIEPQKDNLQNVSYIDDIAGWPEVFDERGVLYSTDIQQLEPRFRAILEPQGIKSMLQCAIMDDGVFRGYVGFDECSVKRLWTQEQIFQLEFLAEVLSVFLLHRRDGDGEKE